MPLSVSIHRASHTAFVDVAGEIDESTVGELDYQLAVALETRETAGTVVDLSDVTFMDSKEINALLNGKRLADSAGKPFRIVGAEGEVRRLLDLTGVWAHLTGHIT